MRVYKKSTSNTTNACSIESLYENINGHTLSLSISKYNNITEVTIKSQTKHSFYSQILLLIGILLTNLFAFTFNIVSVNYFLVLLMVTCFFAFKIFSIIQYENILFIPNLGCQINVKYALGHSTRFTPHDIIDGIFINEVFSMHRVLFILSLLIKEHNKETYLIPLFTGTKPKLNCLEAIFQELHT